MKRRKRGRGFEDNGFAEWGGYMEAKKTKLQDQFKIEAAREPQTDSTRIFDGVAIFVNGYSVPSADELKLLMMKHGGVYHHYFRNGKTTHIIATNLPDTKVKQLKHMNVVKPDWIVESIAAGRLLDFRQYLLYSHQSKTQPKLMFKPVSEPSTSSTSNAPDMHEDFDQETDTPSTTDRTIKSVEESEHIDPVKTPSQFDQNHKEIGNQIKPVTECKDSLTTVKTGIHSIKTASEAGFLTEFYNNSRLHHISTMGASFKQYVNSLREKCTGVFPGMERLKASKQNQSANVVQQCDTFRKYEKVVMHIDMDCFFVSVGLRNRPELKGFPVAVTHAKASAENSSSHRTGVDRKAEFDLYKTRREEKVKGKYQQDGSNNDVKPWSDWVEAVSENDSMSEIASCNYEARKYGLKNGMFLGQALKLCPNLKMIPYDFNGYKEVAYCLYDTIASYTVDIEAVSCDEMFVDCTNLLNVTGTSPQQLASLLRTEIKKYGSQNSVCTYSLDRDNKASSIVASEI
ncbi:deoxycytidyl transferase [Homalodisca vitripennis]|nr:deoxycytidyl transferase [Homalodisca vitripennis]